MRLKRPLRILMQTTVPAGDEPGGIQGFSHLQHRLSALRTEEGRPLCQVMARDLELDSRGNDPVLSRLDSTEFDELWLFIPIQGRALTQGDCMGISRFRERGGSILVVPAGGEALARLAPDHAVNLLGEIGETLPVPFPASESGAPPSEVPEFRPLSPVLPLHELLSLPGAVEARVLQLPAQTGSAELRVPAEAMASGRGRVIATSQEPLTERPLPRMAVLEGCLDAHGQRIGRVVVDADLCHYTDAGWELWSRVHSRPGDLPALAMNLALWLGHRDLAQPLSRREETEPGSGLRAAG